MSFWRKTFFILFILNLLRYLRIILFIQLNPAITYIKGLVRIVLYTKVLFIANIKITMKIPQETKVCMLNWRNYVESGCAIAGFYCNSIVRLKAPDSVETMVDTIFECETRWT